jgi:hypothetical protein
MNAVQVSTILALGLSADEREKLSRIQDRIWALFSRFGKDVRVCEGAGHGAGRLLDFIDGISGPSVIFISAAWFLSATEEDVLDELAVWMRNSA